MSTYTREFVIKEVQNMYRELGNRTPTKDEFVAHSKSKYAYTCLFNRSYNNLLIAAGLPLNYNVQKTHKDCTKEEILAWLREFAAKNPGRTATWLVKNNGKYPRSTITKYIGTPSVVANYLGMAIIAHRTKQYTEKELIDEFKTTAINHPELKSVWDIIALCRASDATYLARIGDAKVLRSIATEARASSKTRKAFAKRYPVKYKPAPVILKWIKRRTEWTREA